MKRIARIILLISLLANLLLFGCMTPPLLQDVSVQPTVINPDGDGVDDVAEIKYRIGRPALLSIYFTDDAGEKHYFRYQKRRSLGEYSTLFNGVIEGDMLPDGAYEYHIEAEDEQGEIAEISGTITLQHTDQTEPELQNFSFFPKVFTPNRDGINDRIALSYYLTKPAKVSVYLRNEEGNKFPLAEREDSLIKPGEVGFHQYDYEGGVDLGHPPPPNGNYVMVAEAVDKLGNRVVISEPLVIKNGGVPRAEIVAGEVEFEPQVFPLGDTLYFTMTVANIGPVPIRSGGPPPGTHYTSSQNFNTLEYYTDPGTFRVGIDFEGNSSGRPYPYRWGVGDETNLTEIDDELYLMPGQRAAITGSIQVVDKPFRPKIYWWGGLIHEDVRYVDDHVDAQEIEIGY